jgi:hypothetical protein
LERVKPHADHHHIVGLNGCNDLLNNGALINSLSYEPPGEYRLLLQDERAWQTVVV